ncbi:MAG: hypothetical protein V1859_10490 [archaeon]
MNEEFWLKYGFKENGELTCVRTLANSKPSDKFFYTEEGTHKEVKNSSVIKITKNVLEKIKELGE